MNMETDLLLRGDGRIIVTGTGDLAETLRTAFEQGSGTGLLAILTAEHAPEAGAGYRYFKNLVRSFALHIIREDGEENPVPPEICSAEATGSPDFTGASQLTAEFHALCYRDFLNALQYRYGNVRAADQIRALHPQWKDLGRITFHLAENKKDTDNSRPFVFLATRQHSLSETGQVKHQTLGNALLEHANDKNALLKLLEPIRTASEKSEILKSLIADNRIFKPCLFSASEAWNFVRDIEIFQSEGIPVRLAGLWKKRPKRLKLEIQLDIGRKRGWLAADSMVKYSVRTSLGDHPLSEEELAEIMNGKGGLIRVKGEWVEAETGKIAELLKKWHKAASAASHGIPFFTALRLLSGTADLEPGALPPLDSELCKVTATEELLESFHSLTRETEVILPEQPGDLLRPYQRDGVCFMTRMLEAGFGVCLADDMGLGKTLQVITVLEKLRKDGAFDKMPALIAAPSSLLDNWQNEFKKFAPELRVRNLHPDSLTTSEKQEILENPEYALSGRCHAAITSYAMLLRQKKLTEPEFPVIVLDEAQQIKNAASQISRTVRSLKSPRRLVMTGTPVENGLSDLWSLFDFIAPGLLGSPESFRKFTAALESGTPPDYTPLRKLVRPFILRRLKTDKSIIPDLPAKIEREEKTALTVLQAKYYRRTVDAMKHDLSMADETSRNGIVLSYLLQFKQICNHPSQYSGNGEYPVERSGKFQRLGLLADMIARSGEKMILFTQFKELTDVLHDLLSKHFGRPGLILHGGTPVPKRAEYVELFQREQGPPFFVISLKAGGTGLNLTAATHVVHFDRWWNPAVEDQATDRAYRIGQKKTVLVHKFVSPGTIEEKIGHLIASKKMLSDTLLEAGAVKLLTAMSDHELLNMVKLDAPADE